MLEDDTERDNASKQNIISPNNSVLFKQDKWMEVINSNKELKGISNKTKRASFVLETFGRGITETFEEYKKKGIDIEVPNIGINPNSDGRAIGYDTKNHLVVITLEFLESISDTEIDLSSKYEFARDDGKVVYRGKLVEWILSQADEEAHHAIYIKTKGKKSVDVDALTMSVAEYDARPIEKRALRWVIQSAKRRNFSEEAIEYLEKRYENANKYIEDNK